MSRQLYRSRLRWADLITESWLEVTRRPGRAVISGLGVALGVAAMVATVTLTATIQFQVSDEFDARRATQVEVRTAPRVHESDGIPHLFPPSGTVDRLMTLSGVEGVAAIRESWEHRRVALHQVTDPTATPTLLPVYAVNAEAFTVLEAEVTGLVWNRWHEAHDERLVVLSRAAMKVLGVTDVQHGDLVFIDGLAFTVTGVLEEAPRHPALTGGVLVPLPSAERFRPNSDRDRMIAVVAPGAAQSVANALPVALDPTEPARWTAYAPASDESLRQAVDRQLEMLSVGLGGVVLVLGVVSIGNVTLSSVVQRMNEIGLRRALGARPRHIAAHIVFDAAVVGTLGGALGALLGMTATLAVTVYRGWAPVIDLMVVPMAMVLGLLAGAVAGIYPARVGSRLQPTDALRRA